jgi:hypothetical protein
MVPMAKKKIKINRAPVITLWAAVVAERLGHDRATALTLGKAVAGLNAQSKGRRLGIYEEADEGSEKEKGKKPAEAGEAQMVTLLGRPEPAVQTKAGLRATDKDDLYEKFRPDIPEGQAGWGAKGDLDLDLIRSLGPAKRARG